MALTDQLIKDGWLKTPEIIQAFQKVKRKDFLPDELDVELAEFNQALPIDYGQTISQPLVVAFMLELLKPNKGDKILDIGSGSGFTAALLAEIVGKQGKIIALELVPELAEFGKANVSKYNFIKKGIAEFICADGSKGWPTQAPYDKILCSAAAQKQGIPSVWKEQLKNNGRIVMPISSSIWLFEKKGRNKFIGKEFPGFSFVPLIHNS